jgi:hypothetical protein
MAQDRTGVPGHEQPPPRPLALMVTTVALNVLALIAILLDYCDLAGILIALAILLGGFTICRIMGSSRDEQPVGGHEQPPP